MIWLCGVGSLVSVALLLIGGGVIPLWPADDDDEVIEP